MPPRNKEAVSLSLLKKIAACLSTRFDLSATIIQRHLRTAKITQYGKVRRIDGPGDTMNASTLVPVGDDRRDASFVRVSTN